MGRLPLAPGELDAEKLCSRCQRTRPDVIAMLISFGPYTELNERRLEFWKGVCEKRDKTKMCENERSKYTKIFLSTSLFMDKCGEVAGMGEFCKRCKDVEEKRKKWREEKARGEAKASEEPMKEDDMDEKNDGEDDKHGTSTF